MTLHFSLNLKFFPDSQQEFEKFHKTLREFMLPFDLGAYWDASLIILPSGPYKLLCKYPSNVNVFDKAVFILLTCDSEIPCSFWVCVFNHSEAKETGVFPSVEQTGKAGCPGRW